jgi:hypothetical protein
MNQPEGLKASDIISTSLFIMANIKANLLYLCRELYVVCTDIDIYIHALHHVRKLY